MSRGRISRDRRALPSKSGRVNGSRQPHRRRLRFEPLEDRRLLAITVDTLVDELEGSITDGDISLRDAIRLAPAGETINFAPALTASGPATILLTHCELAILLSLMVMLRSTAPTNTMQTIATIRF